MDIQTFEAFSMKDAVKAVKKSLGPDAVILSTREKPMPNGKPPVIEVTAAAAHKISGKIGAQKAAQAKGLSSDDFDDVDRHADALSTKLSILIENSPSREQVSSLEFGLGELKALLIEALRSKEGSSLQGLPPHIIPIERQLRSMGLEESCLAELVRHLQTMPIFEAGQTGEAIESYYRDQAIRS
jgi:flagellar biosynthesis protein FlhF